MAAIAGLSSSSREGPIGPSPSGDTRSYLPAANSFRSAPAQKVPPSPQSTATLASASASNARKASASDRAVSGSTAFRADGRLRMTVVTGPCFSTRTLMRRSLAPCLGVENGGAEHRPGPRQVPILNRHPRRLDVALRLTREGRLGAGQLGLDAGVSPRKSLLCCVERVQPRLHQHLPVLVLLLLQLPAGFRVRDLLPDLLQLQRELLELLRDLLCLPALLLQCLQTGPELLELAVDVIGAGIAIRADATVGRGLGRAEPARRVGAEQQGPLTGVRPRASVRPPAFRAGGRAGLGHQKGDHRRGNETEQAHQGNLS